MFNISLGGRHAIISGIVLLACLLTGVAPCITQAESSRPGALLLVGGVLSLKERVVWQRITELVGGEVVVIAAANHRPKLYGNYAVRGLSRAGLSAQLLPIALSVDEFGRDYRDATADPEIVARLLDSDAVFFVGGAPQRLAEVLSSNDASRTPLAGAIVQHYSDGGLIIGGIPEQLGAHTGIDALQVLERGMLPAGQIYHGLGLMAPGWYLDQQLFVSARLGESLVAMRQHALDYGIGIAPGAAALIENGQLEVIGDAGVILIDLTSTKTDADTAIFNLRGVRLSYLGDGDRIDLQTARVTPDVEKLDGFEIRPGAAQHAPTLTAGADLPDTGALVRHMLISLDGESGQSLDSVLSDENRDGVPGFQFRYYADDDTIGWLSAVSAGARYTALNVHLDIEPMSQEQVDRQRHQSRSMKATSAKTTE